MTETASTVQDITLSLTVAAPTEVAWRVFTEGLGTWWPKAYTWSGDARVELRIEPGAGGLCTEIGPHGFRCDWVRVTDWEPPRLLQFLWQISPRREPVPNPDRASEITVQFAAAPDGGTEVTFTHGHFDHHGDGAAAYRDAMASPQGWPWILEWYARAANGTT